MTVSETFFSLEVGDMQRATAFYVDALGATVKFTSPTWSSLFIAGVRIGLFLDPARPAQPGALQSGPGRAQGKTGLHFVVAGLAATCAEIQRAGGKIVEPAREVAPGVVIAEVSDPEGNRFTLRSE